MIQQILDFWFKEIEPKQWWVKDVGFDQLIRDRFAVVHRQAAACECFAWRTTAAGRLAEIIVLDQFSRNMFRDTPGAFAQDPLALALAQEAVSRGADLELESKQRSFLYMPYMHSESPAIHEQAVKLFDQPGLDQNLDFEIKHKEIIDKYGRYPHRNAILGRESTPEELDYLKDPNVGF